MGLFAQVTRRNALLWRITTRLKLRLIPHEPEMVLLPILVPAGKLAIDIGGNMGNYAAALADLTGRVVVFEPNPSMAADLRRLLGHKVAVQEAALSDKPGRLTLRIPETGSGRATIEPDNDLAGAATTDVEVDVLRLDDLDYTDVGFVKIDVEGHELAVLHGAERLLRKWKPNLLVEAEDDHRSGAVASVRDYLGSLGYTGFALAAGRVVPMDAAPPGTFNFIYAHADGHGVSRIQGYSRH